MIKCKASPQTITLFLVCLSLIPRFFSEYAFQMGTVVILIFWIAPLVLLSELIPGYSNKKINVSGLDLPVKISFVVCILIITCSFWWRDFIYSDYDDKIFKNTRRFLYLIHPIIYLSWYYSVNKKLLKRFLNIGCILSIGLILSLLLPVIINNSIIGLKLNSLTAKYAAFVYSFFTNNDVSIRNQFFFNNEFSIKVGGGCSSTPQIMISLYSILVMYLCCKIKSKKNIFIITIFAILIAFSINIFRVSLMAYFVSITSMNRFDFWHDGAGSLIFSFFIMLYTSTIYYYLWSKENPIEK